MVKLIRVHGANHSDVVHYLREMRQKIGYAGPTLALLFELLQRTQDLGIPFDKREALSLGKLFGYFLSAELLKLRLVIQQFELEGRHETGR